MKSDFEKRLNKLAKEINQMIQIHEYTFVDIFPKAFMLKNTNSASIENFLANSPVEIDFSTNPKNLSSTKLNKYVSENTPFATWNAMYIKGVKTFLAKKLGL